MHIILWIVPSLKLSTGNFKTILNKTKINSMPLSFLLFLARNSFSKIHLFPTFFYSKTFLFTLVLGFGLLHPCELQCKADCLWGHNRIWLMWYFFISVSVFTMWRHERMHRKHFLDLLAGKCQLEYISGFAY